MKKFKYLLVLLLILCSACEEEISPDYQYNLFKMKSEVHLVDMELNSKDEFYYVTTELDNTVEIPLYSSYLPSKVQLFKQSSETSDHIVLDPDFIGINEILFDKNDKLWARSMKNLFLINSGSIDTIIDLNNVDGLLKFIAVDRDNTIWTGGLNTGLYKIDNNLAITHYRVDNSTLPTNSMTNIHIDKQNNIWIALWENRGVLKISDTESMWEFYNSSNSTITNQNIWCLVSDKDGNIWIGTGHDNENQNLMKFNGNDWIYERPLNSKNNFVSGTVRGLYNDDTKLYVVVVQSDKAAFTSNSLLTFDGTTWEKISTVPEDDGIDDIKIDHARGVAWIRTLNKGIFKLDLL
ncbi:MAG: hypothetical protein JW801_10960 [Bacteroidales bacterium]|nr:hypothetical protein [Bacteroidales bacterium]